MEHKSEDPEVHGQFTADDRGRITLGKEYAEEDFSVVAELDNQTKSKQN